MTLVELLAVSAILLMMAGMLGSLSLAVQTTHDSQYQRGLTLQHGQVVLDRLRQRLDRAVGNENFPGAAVFAQTIGSVTYPDTLVVWCPATTPAAPTGLPRISELVVFCPNPNDPSELWEIRNPADTRTVPAVTNASAWQTELASLRSSSSVERVVLTDLLRTATPTGESGTSSRLAALRFEVVRRPSATEWAAYRANTLAWTSVSFAQGIRGPTFGLSQTVVRWELQLRPGDSADLSREASTPFFGASSLFFPLTRSS